MWENEKYVVFKKDEWDKWYQGEYQGLAPKPIDDAVVIRRQDAFAPPALDAYANSIACALQLGPREATERMRGLQDIADYFHEQAQIAWDTHRKLPD